MAIGVVYLFLLLASPLIAQPFYCEVYNFHNPTARNRAVADRVGMIQLYCRGGVAGTPRDFDITVSMNLPLGNRNPSGSYSDALLFLGNPPPYSQVANQNVFLGEFVPPGVGSKVPHSVRFHVHTTEPGPNEWQK